MIYDAYQAYADMAHPVRTLAANAESILTTWGQAPYNSPLQRMAAYYELVALAGFSHARPDYCIGEVMVDGVAMTVREEIVLDLPFGSLLRFKREDGADLPKVLLIAPMSGHFATLLRNTVRTLLQDHDVYISDWKNARDVKLGAGPFGLDDFTAYVIDFIHALGPQSHVVAVCQPTVAALAAVAVLAAAKDPDQPASLTLMAGPIDTRISPTKVNELATDKPIEWFRDKLTGIVPSAHNGAGRRVYPGFLQLAAFMSMNIERHAKSFVDMFKHRIEGEYEKADAIKAFYQEYFAIMDLPGEFYLETVETVFQKWALPQGELTFRGTKVDPAEIRRTFLLTVEGERDDICAPGQTLAAHDLCSRLRPYMKSHHLQTGVGHYGVFSGKRWDNQIYPAVRDHIRASL
jgi:polyhydroxyalkanoate depolymerase